MVHAVAPGAAISTVLVKQSAVRSPADFAAALTAFLRLGLLLLVGGMDRTHQRPGHRRPHDHERAAHDPQPTHG